MPEPNAPVPKGGRGKIGGVPKPVAIAALVGAIVLGLYLRSKNKASTGSTTATPAADPSIDPATGIPYSQEQSSGATSPYNPYSALAGSTGGFDASSFEQGVTYGQGLNVATIPPSTDGGSQGPVSSVSSPGGTSPTIINITTHSATPLKPTPGKPHTSGRKHPKGVLAAPSGHNKPPAKKGYKIVGKGHGRWEYVKIK